jgi:hypothetical protein
MKGKESGRFFEKKLRKKLLRDFTRDVSTSRRAQKFFGSFFQKRTSSLLRNLT